MFSGCGCEDAKLVGAAMASEENRPSEAITDDLDHSKYTFEGLVAMRVEFPGVDDLTLARFLVARNGDTSKSIPLLRDHLEWRKANLPIKKEEILDEMKLGKIYLRGFDKNNHPVVVWNARLHSLRNRDIDVVMKSAIYWLEYGIAKLPPGKIKFTFILNRIGATSDSADLELAKKIIKLFSDNFPERLLTFVVYPSGIVFWGLWNLVKIFLDPVTQAKVRPVMTLAGVEEVIAIENIPASMGGKDTYEFNLHDFIDYSPTEESTRLRTTVHETASTRPDEEIDVPA